LQTIDYSVLLCWRLFDLLSDSQTNITPFEWVRCGSLMAGWVS
jgi:hypothetical protein